MACSIIVIRPAGRKSEREEKLNSFHPQSRREGRDCFVKQRREKITREKKEDDD